MFDHNYLSTLSLIDFDAVERWKPGTIPFLLKPVLSGKKSIWVEPVQCPEGSGDVPGGEGVPSRRWCGEGDPVGSGWQPEKYDTTKPVPLPFGLRNLWTKGNAVGGQT